MIDNATRAYVRDRFRDYYDSLSGVEHPPDSWDREWAFIRFGTSSMERHYNLKSVAADMFAYLASSPKRHVYASAATYEDPGETSMDAKGRYGTDLVFDIDADHIPGITADTPYPKQLHAAKLQVQDLLLVLDRYFGVSDVEIVFSGRRGYHVHVRDDEYRGLDTAARETIVEYLTGESIDVESVITLTDNGAARLAGNGFWASCVASRYTHDMEVVASGDDHPAFLEKLHGIGEVYADRIAKRVRSNPNWYTEGGVGGTDAAFGQYLESTVEEVVEESAVHVDAPVTTDLHRIMRVPETLHGGTGLRACRVEPADLGPFDPLDDAVPTIFQGNETRVDLEVSLDDHPYAPNHNVGPGDATIPEPIAIRLMAMGDARYAGS